jgi:glycine betaine/proline transport system substrate-binding protein
MERARLSHWTLLLLLLTTLMLGACTVPAADDAAPAPEAAEPASEPVVEESAAEEAAAGEQITIKLAENPWSASALNVAVARILLEEELGYPVEVVTIGETPQWPAIAAGDLHASLEVWPSGHAENVAEYIDNQGLVENGGPLGPVGKIGWYIPSYLLEEHPDLATWEGLQVPENAALFATAETGDKGQFLTGDPSWTQYEDDIIANLGLNFQIVAAGSEEAILAALDAAVSRQEPLLFYFWTPHSVHAKYDLTEVALPEYSEACYAKAEEGGIDCDYPPDNLFKIFWAELAEAAPDAYTLLKNMSYTTDDQIQMIAAVELEGKSVEEAARDWLAGNEETWRAWLPQ